MKGLSVLQTWVGATSMRAKKTGAKRVEKQSNDKLAAEWDVIAPYREDLIATGRDLSYRHILLPSLKKLLDEMLAGSIKVLDVGCGTGNFLSELAGAYPSNSFVGIDPSEISIAVAYRKRRPRENCEFRVCTVEEMAADPAELAAFDALIANMLLQNVADVDKVLSACSSLLKPGGIFVFAVAHPCFWPRYWGYDEEQWFEYKEEIWVDAPFRTSLSNPSSSLRTTHVHRSLSAYLNGLFKAGLVVEQISEPTPDDDIEGAYPVAWEFPRFLIGRARKPAPG